MENNFTIYLDSPVRKNVLRIAKILIVLFTALSIYSAVVNGGIINYSIAAILVLGCIAAFTKFKTHEVYMAVMFLLSSAPLAKYNAVLAVVAIPLAYLFYISARQWVFNFSDKAIILNTGFAKTLNWQDIAGIHWRDNLLTLDLKNNKIIQLNIDTTRTKCSKDEFINYCNSKIV
jgi:hypothetical protein